MHPYMFLMSLLLFQVIANMY